MADQPKTPQGWAWDYLRNRLKIISELLGSPENLPELFTFADLKEGDFFIRFPWAEIKNGKIVFRNTELCRKIVAVKQMHGPGCYYTAIRVITGSLLDIPDNEPVVVIR